MKTIGQYFGSHKLLRRLNCLGRVRQENNEVNVYLFQGQQAGGTTKRSNADRLHRFLCSHQFFSETRVKSLHERAKFVLGSLCQFYMNILPRSGEALRRGRGSTIREFHDAVLARGGSDAWCGHYVVECCSGGCRPVSPPRKSAAVNRQTNRRAGVY